MTLRRWPTIVTDIKDTLKRVLDERNNDIAEWDNLPQRFVAGRKVARTPSGSSDVTVSDCLGDINYDANYLYILVDNAGTYVWRRVSLASW